MKQRRLLPTPRVAPGSIRGRIDAGIGVCGARCWVVGGRWVTHEAPFSPWVRQCLEEEGGVVLLWEEQLGVVGEVSHSHILGKF